MRRPEVLSICATAPRKDPGCLILPDDKAVFTQLTSRKIRNRTPTGRAPPSAANIRARFYPERLFDHQFGNREVIEHPFEAPKRFLSRISNSAARPLRERRAPTLPSKNRRKRSGPLRIDCFTTAASGRSAALACGRTSDDSARCCTSMRCPPSEDPVSDRESIPSRIGLH